jgi:sigma-B regulation protein RsbU (phosphoserine phosphatase)
MTPETLAIQALDELFKARIPAPIAEGEGPGQDLIARINQLSAFMAEMQGFIVPLAKGQLSSLPPRSGNFMASPFKELHSRLCELTWQAQQVARGDYSQRIDFMGDFSEAFNSMVQALDTKDRDLKATICHLEQEEERIRLLNTQLTASNRKIMESLEYARLIQTALLPLPEVMTKCLPEHFVIFRPRDIVGGDFYVHIADAEGCLLGVGDCSGHGVPGAFMSMAAGALLKQIVTRIGPEEPATILGEMNTAMKALMHQGTRTTGSQQLDNGLDLALVLLAPGSSVRFAGARLDLWLHAPEDGWTVVPGDSQGLGYRRSKTDFPYVTHDVPWAEGVVGYLFSDGILDQPGGANGYGLGRTRLQQELELLQGYGVKKQGQRLETFLATYQGTQPQRDDITIMGFRPNLPRE